MNENEPAFPGLSISENCASGEVTRHQIYGGFTKRELGALMILQGFAANPAVFAYNAQCGWSLVNSTEAELVAYAERIADHALHAAEHASVAELSKEPQ